MLANSHIKEGCFSHDKGDVKTGFDNTIDFKATSKNECMETHQGLKEGSGGGGNLKIYERLISDTEDDDQQT